MNIKSQKKNLYFVISIILFIFLFLFNDYYKTKKGSILDEILILTNKKAFYYDMHGEGVSYKNVLKELFNVNLLKSLFENNQEDTIYINIKQKNLNTLLEYRNQSLALYDQDQYLINRKKVNANIKFKGEHYPVKIRLKGDRADHWKNNKRWSFAVDVKNNSIDTYQNFSLQGHARRQFPQNEVMSLSASRAGIITSSFKSYNVIFNGDDWGKMYLEENYSSGFYEKRKLKETPIAKFIDSEADAVVAKTATKDFPREKISKFFDLHTKYGIDPYHKKKNWKKDTTIFDISLLEHINIYVKKHDITPLEKDIILRFLDEKKIAAHLALISLFNDWHSSDIVNLRFYLNPFSLKIEPIPTDFAGQNSSGNFGIILNIEEFRKRLDDLPEIYKINFERINFWNLYFKYLDQFVDDMNNIKIDLSRICNQDKNCVSSINFKKIIKNYELLKKNKNYLSKISFSSFPIQPIAKSNLEKEIKLNQLDQKIANNSKNFIYSRLYKNGEIKIYNINYFPISINKIILSDCNLEFIKEITIDSAVELNLNLSKNFQNCFEKSKTYKIYGQAFDKSFDQEFLIHNNIFLPEKFFKVKFSNSINKNYISEVKNDSITLKQGSYAVNTPIVLFNTSLTILEGTKLYFSPNSYIKIINGDLNILGSPNKIVYLNSLKDNSFWKGIYVYNSKKSSIQNSSIKNLTFFNDGNFTHLTGGINFYRSFVDINNVSIFNTDSEDAINLVHSKFKINNFSIKKTRSDAIDTDFSDGTINNYFADTIGIDPVSLVGYGAGADAIDTSGSKIFMSNINVTNVEDKCISSGEQSNLRIENISAQNCGAGIAVKDNSLVKVKKIFFNNNKTDISLYRKKSYYVYGGKIYIKNDNLKNIKIKKDKFSEIFYE